MATARDPVADSVWGRTPRGPSEGSTGSSGLTRPQIVAAAVELLDRDGAAGLSMRKLGQHLGSGTTSVYWHVANKNELVDLALDEVWGEIVLPADRPDDWRAALAAYVHDFRDLLVRHPWIVSFIGERPDVGPKATLVSDRVLGLLTSVGFSVRDAAYAGSALSSYALGNGLADVSWRASQSRWDMDAEELAGRFTEYYDAMGDQYPNLTRWLKENQPLDMDAMRSETFEFGLRCQLDGLAILLAR